MVRKQGPKHVLEENQGLRLFQVRREPRLKHIQQYLCRFVFQADAIRQIGFAVGPGREDFYAFHTESDLRHAGLQGIDQGFGIKRVPGA